MSSSIQSPLHFDLSPEGVNSNIMEPFITRSANERFSSWSTANVMPPAERPSSVKAADHVYLYLKHLIVTLQLPPRSIITETEVATVTGVSRTPVREAFFKLQVERLLDILPQRGAMVPEITLRNIQEQAQTRVVLEGFGIEWICNNFLPVADELRALLREQERIFADDPNRVVEMVTVDKEFHWALVKATGNTEFAQLYNTLHDRQLRIGIAMFEAVPKRRHEAICQHADIITALETHDLETALALLKDHLIGSLDQLSGIFTN
ncbi:MAG: GntR family transcriptional regulator [Microbacteriaceae bacterium]